MKLPDFRKMRTSMIDSQLRPSGINDNNLIASLKYVPREIHVPAEVSSLAYRDEEIEVFPGRYLLSPLAGCLLMSALEVRPTDKVLIIGGTIGYSAAVLARLAAHITLVENDSTLVRRANSAISKTAASNVEVVEAPLEDGYAANGPYDAVLIDGLAETIPPAIVAQVRDGGRIAALLGMPGETPSVSLGLKSGGRVGWTSLLEANAHPLPGFERAHEFEF